MKEAGTIGALALGLGLAEGELVAAPVTTNLRTQASAVLLAKTEVSASNSAISGRNLDIFPQAGLGKNCFFLKVTHFYPKFGLPNPDVP